MRTVSRWVLGLAVLWGTGAGCSSKPAGPGEACTRSAQCKIGLACIEGRCSDDLDALRDQSTVPMLMPDEPAEEQPPAAGQPGAQPTGAGQPGAQPTGAGQPGAQPTGAGQPGAQPTDADAG